MRKIMLIMAILIGTLAFPQPAQAATIGNVTGFAQNGNIYTINAGSSTVRVIWSKVDIFRIWLAPSGTFTDPAGTDIAITQNFGTVSTTWSDAGSYYRINTSAVTMRVYKTPLTFRLYKADNTTLIWSESTGLTWTGTNASQTLTRGATEQFYGTGLRLGDWALRDKSVPIKIDNAWRENNNASPAPFFMSTNGYGMVRNTWTPGQYNFLSPVSLTHNESRFDAFYFAGNSLKDVLNRYTDVTGKPFMAPIWGFELGNADCWNASNPDYTGDHNRARHQTTPDVVGYATDARNADMPSGWFLPNDGYGCSYTSLPQTVTNLQAKGFKTGLWTSTGLANINWEVGTAGSRAVKTDVAWIGGGYKTAFNGVQQAVNGIENNSNARRFVWTVDGWAGTQRNAVVWTGDTYGTWADMRWHVPAITGAGLSALNYAAGDVDGIYSGGPKTYVRDLQWKAFTPAFMTMSGWGATNPASGYHDKQPWRYSDPYLSINRKYLKLKMRLTPYMYTMSRVAHETGVPSTRALVLEYPNDPVAQGNQTRGQFMAGDSFLVAPVVSDTTVRDGIYLPAGTWTDYWTGQVFQGPGTLNGYNAPLDTLPLFVKGGAIVPMWPQMNYAGEKPVTPITLDLYPRGNSSFTLYEDDGLTRSYQTGSFAKQQITMAAPTSGTGDVTVTVGGSNGSFTGKQSSRGYEAAFHTSAATSVTLDGVTLTRHTTQGAYDSASTGWFHSGGVLRAKTGPRSTGTAFTVKAFGVTLPTTTPIGGGPIPKTNWQLVYADSQETVNENGAAINAFDGNPSTMWHSQWSSNPDAPLPHEIQIDLGATYNVDSLRYLPRQDGGINGRIGQYEIYISSSTSSWGAAITGTFADTATEKAITFPARTGRYVRLRAITEAGNRGPWTSCAEITLTGTPA